MDILGWKAWDSDEAVWNSRDHSWDSLPDSLQCVVLYRQSRREIVSGQPTTDNENDPCWYVLRPDGKIVQFVGQKADITDGIPKEGVWAPKEVYDRIYEAALRATWQ